MSTPGHDLSKSKGSSAACGLSFGSTSVPNRSTKKKKSSVVDEDRDIHRCDVGFFLQLQMMTHKNQRERESWKTKNY